MASEICFKEKLMRKQKNPISLSKCFQKNCKFFHTSILNSCFSCVFIVGWWSREKLQDFCWNFPLWNSTFIIFRYWKWIINWNFLLNGFDFFHQGQAEHVSHLHVWLYVFYRHNTFTSSMFGVRDTFEWSTIYVRSFNLKVLNWY